MQELADIHSVKADLIVPDMVEENPQAGKRVKQTIGPYQNTQNYHSIYLPKDWQPDKKYPVIVEYAGNGNYKNNYGDISTGKVEHSNLGYGISAGEGVIWLCLPYINTSTQSNEIKWWGDVEATVVYCKEAIAQVCEQYGGDKNNIFISGFSRGAIACNFVGLHDEKIASLWRGFICYSHYDGMINWPYPGSDREAAKKRLQRLDNRPQFICHEISTSDTESYLREVYPNGNFTFLPINFRNHNDAWVLRDIPERKILRSWFQDLLKTS